MKISLYNSLERNIVPFEPVESGKVKIYSCGPTVYNYAHIGNMRAFLFADLLQRVMRVVGEYEVKWVMNITNIDDKTIRDSAVGSEQWKPGMGVQTEDPMQNLLKLTDFYQKAFTDDISVLGIEPEHFYAMPKATDYIPGMQDLIKILIEKGLAYPSEGSFYFNVSEWRKRDTYGKLFKIDFDNFISGTRIDSDQYDREQASDFALWKARKEGEPYWDFRINDDNFPGRPGWHIECSVMEKEILGLPFDIHTGGVDLKFPHHEDEIAQSKAGYDLEPTNFWCHNEFLEVEGQKMSKSLGNFFTVRDLISKNIEPLDIRYLMLSTHYSSVLNFTFDGIQASRKARLRVQEYIYELFSNNTGINKPDIMDFREKVLSKLSNDLHTPHALGTLFKFINSNPAKDLDLESKTNLIKLFELLNKVFAVWKLEPKPEEQILIPQEIIDLAEKRVIAKKEKNFKLCDEIREQIKSSGYLVKDTRDGFEIEAIR